MHSLIERHLDRVKAKKAESSYETHYSNLKNFNQWLAQREEDLTQLRALDLEDYFMTQMEQGYAPNTIASRYESVRALFNRLAGRFEEMAENPFEDLERKELVVSQSGLEFASGALN